MSGIKERAEECLNYAKKMRRKYEREKNRLMFVAADEFVREAKYILTGKKSKPKSFRH